MSSTGETQTLSASDTIGGLDVALTAELPTFATEEFMVTADITQSELSQDINVALVLDTSGSTGGNSGSDVDGDGDNDTFLEAQQFAAKALFQQLLDAGYNPEDVTVTLIEYNGSASTVGNFTLSDQSAFDDAVDDLDDGGFTNFDDALDEVIDQWAATTTDGNADDSPESEVTANDSNFVLFLSDGFPNQGGTNFADEVATLENDYNASITAIGVGANSSLTQLNNLDNTGGAEQVTDASQLADIIGAPPPLPELQQVEIVVDGEVLAVFPPSALIETPFGYRLDCETITGYDYQLGEDLEVEVRAVFEPGGDILTVGTIQIPQVPCFVLGTLILTPLGYVPIESLKIGSRVVTRDHGTQVVRWIGQSTISSEMLNAHPELRPVKIAKGALGDGAPLQDLYVSRQHRILVRDWRAEVMFGAEEGVLSPAASLINDKTIVTDHASDEVTYVHVAFDNHEVLYADGVEAESFHPASEMVAGMTPAQRAELLAIFPELELPMSRAFESARIELKMREGGVL